MTDLSPLLEEALQNGRDVIFTITGSSMKPLFYHRRDKVRLVPPSEMRPLKKYDILLYVHKDGRYILHRIIAVKAEGYVLRGDNQYSKEYPVQPSQILGVVKGFWRDGKYIGCDNFWYRLYCRFWLYIYPVRRIHSKLDNIGSKQVNFREFKNDEG